MAISTDDSLAALLKQVCTQSWEPWVRALLNQTGVENVPENGYITGLSGSQSPHTQNDGTELISFQIQGLLYFQVQFIKA